MMTSGRCDTSMLGSCDQKRYAENPRKLRLFFMRKLFFLMRLYSRLGRAIGIGNLNAPWGRRWLGARSVKPRLISMRSTIRESLYRRSHLTVRALRLNQSAAFTVIIKNFPVPSPVHRRIKLALYFIFRKVVIQNVAEEFVVDGVIGFALQDAIDLFEDGFMLERRFAE